MLRDDDSRRVERCSGCGLLQVVPRPTPEEDRAFYDANSQDRSRGKEIDADSLRGNNRYDTDRHVRLLDALDVAPDSRILDVGAGYGFFTAALLEAGYRDVTGFEISRERRELANKWGSVPVLGIDVNSSDLGEHAAAYDVVTLFHVLEHAGDPVAFLRDLARFVAPGGLLVVEVPNARELMLETVPPYDDFYWIRAHLSYFEADSLLRTFAEAGLPEPELRFEQRYGLLNLSNWLLQGAAQIERPTFEIDEPYRGIEDAYRAWLAEQGRTDALVGIARMP